MVSRVIARHGRLHEVCVHTGQHYDETMSEVFFRELEIPRPKYNLGIGSGLNGDQTGRMLSALERVILEQKPQWVVVYGDTNSTLAGALAAAKLRVPVAHVEAGLRSYNRAMPEELNRVVADHLSSLLFAPTQQAVQNLAREGIAGPSVHQVGDVMYDATLHYGALARSQSQILQDWGLKEKGYLLATIHRAENADCAARLGAIVSALERINLNLPVIWPVHPRTRKELALAGINPAVRMESPVGYLHMQRLEQSAAVILTDSGGVQKEAAFHGVPCVTVRTETEWVELVEGGWNRLANPADADAIVHAVASARGSALPPVNQLPYGDGRAAEEIVRILADHA